MIDYKVIGHGGSRAFRVMWMLEELGLPYAHVAANPQTGDVIALNPAGKIPVLVEDGVPITDSTAIVQYLADRHGRFTAPAGTMARAQQDSITQFLLDEFDAALWMAARHSFVLPKELRHSAIKDTLRWEFARAQATLARRMAEVGSFVMGTELSVPDIILAHCGMWAEDARFAITEPRLVEYMARMRSRPAFVRALAR